jgi:hypothetical protein
MKRNPRSHAAARAAIVLLAGMAALPAAAAAQSTDSPLTVHGYLTQGVGRATQRALFGLDTATTTDYRAAAVQVRYAMTDDDQFLVQFAHRRLGTSLLNGAMADVALDWVFYQRQFAGVTAKVGRVPTPRGIYNEIRDVGTILPFYRAPYNFYTEGGETVDGASLKYTHGLGAGFTADLNGFAGGWDYKQLTLSTSTGQTYMASSRAQYAFGAQAWLNTPISGVRLGVGGQTFRFDEYALLVNTLGPGAKKGTLMQASLDATRDRFYVRGEVQEFQVEDEFHYPAWYAQAGVKPISRLGLHVQTDRARVKMDTRLSATVVLPLDYEYARDNAVGATFAVSPNFVLKGEAHDARGYNFDRFVSPIAPQAKSRYWLASAAVSF